MLKNISSMKIMFNYISSCAVGLVATVLLFIIITYSTIWPSDNFNGLFWLQNRYNILGSSLNDELGIALQGASMANKTLIIGQASKESLSNGMVELFLASLREVNETAALVDHLLVVVPDESSFNQCIRLKVRCYKPSARGDADVVLAEVLKKGYSFVFTDFDTIWLRNPFLRLSNEGQDLQISNRSSDNVVISGFYFVAANRRTVALFEKFVKNGTKGGDNTFLTLSQDALQNFGIKFQFLDTAHFSSFCQEAYDAEKVTTVDANCCRDGDVNITDLKAMLDAWRSYNGTSTLRLQTRWRTCAKLRKEHELERALRGASLSNRTVIVSVLNKAYVEKDGMLDLFLRSFREGKGTQLLPRHILFVTVDAQAFTRCKGLGLNCYQLATEGAYSKEAFYMTEDFISLMWRRTLLLGDILRLGYNFIFTDMDVMWLRNPFTILKNNGEDLHISCDRFNGRPYDQSNALNTGFFYVVSNNKTIALFDEWYARRNSSKGMKEQDVLMQMKSQGAFRRLGLKVRFLDTTFFSGFCNESRDRRKVVTVHANCCLGIKAKLTDLTAVLNSWKKNKGRTKIGWPPHQACKDSWKNQML